MERSEGVEGESPQRCKARLERHRRTAERAVWFSSYRVNSNQLLTSKEFVCNVLALWQAKALAEKNMRDLLAQREQAERNVMIFHEEFFELSNLLCISHAYLTYNSNLIFLAEISRNSGCWCQEVVQRERRKLACIAFNFAICMVHSPRIILRMKLSSGFL